MSPGKGLAFSVDSPLLSGVGKGVALRCNVVSRVKSAFLYSPVEGSKHVGLQVSGRGSLPRICECRSVNSWWATPRAGGSLASSPLRAHSC